MKLLTTLTIVSVGLIAGCGKDDFQEVTGVCPLVISTIPTNGATGVHLDQIVSATFNETMDRSTITEGSFTLKREEPTVGIVSNFAAQEAPLVQGTVTYSGQTAYFTPSSHLLPNTSYTGTITTAAKDPRGNALQENYVWSFTTNEAPRVIFTDPETNGVDVLLNQRVIATFSEPMDSSVLAGSNSPFTVKIGNTQIAGTVSYRDSTATFTPLVALLPFTVYTATITTRATDVLGYPMAADYEWNFTTIPQVTLLSNPTAAGITSGAGLFAQDSLVTVSVIPNAGFVFSNWTEGVNIVSSSPSYQFTMNGNKTLVANFSVAQYVVALSSLPSAGGVTTGAATYNSGTPIIITAVPNAGYVFTNWTEGVTVISSLANYPFTVTRDRNLVANFTQIQYTVALSSLPTAGGSTTGAATYNFGTLVTVAATPSNGYTFKNWTEGVNIISTLPSYTFSIGANRTLVANFTQIQYTVALSSLPTAGGSTTGAATYNSGALVTVAATPSNGYTFLNWTEGVNIISTLPSYSFNIGANRTLVANFTQIQYTVALSSLPTAGGSTTGAATYNSGALVTVAATPSNGYTFKNWTEGVNIISTLASYSFNIGANRTFVANFTLNAPVGPGQVNLGTAINFATVTKSGISTTGVTHITGDIGVSPIAASAMTGFGLVMHSSNEYSTTPIVTGKVYASDYATPTPAKMTLAVSDMETAYTTANLLVTPAPIVNQSAGNLSGQTLAPGLYKWTTGVSITTGITLAGGPNDTWVFQVEQDLTVNNSAIITLSGGAQAKNIFWIVKGQALLGTAVNFSGIILCKTLIALQSGAVVNGRLFAQTGVTIIGSTITQPQ